MVNKEDFYIDIKNRAKDIYEQYQYLVIEALKSDPSSYSLEFYIKEDSSLGGKAWSKNNLDNIQINKGVIDNYFDYFYGFTKMQTDDFLEKLHIEDMEEASYEFIKFDGHGNPNLFDSKVIDYKLAGLLTIFVSRFIITHELGHLLNGHCEYLNSKDQNDMQHIQMFEKDNSKNIKNVSSLDFRTLEMDADAFAATDNFRNLLLIYGKFEDMVDKDLNIEPIELFYWWSFAIRSNFLITQKILNDEEYRPDKKHLPSVARWVLILGSIVSIIDEGLYKINYRTGDNKEKILEYIAKGFLFAEKQYNERFYTNYNCLEETINSTDYSNYVTATQKNWENLRNELSKYSRLLLYKSNNV
jgi:hypothetical protein